MRLAHNGQIVSFRKHLQSSSQMKYKRGKKKRAWNFNLGVSFGKPELKSNISKMDKFIITTNNLVTS